MKLQNGSAVSLFNVYDKELGSLSCQEHYPECAGLWYPEVQCISFHLLCESVAHSILRQFQRPSVTCGLQSTDPGDRRQLLCTRVAHFNLFILQDIVLQYPRSNAFLSPIQSISLSRVRLKSTQMPPSLAFPPQLQTKVQICSLKYIIHKDLKTIQFISFVSW